MADAGSAFRAPARSREPAPGNYTEVLTSGDRKFGSSVPKMVFLYCVRKFGSSVPMNKLKLISARVQAVLSLAVVKFIRLDGAEAAAAFAYNAFFALFPLIILFVTIASLFVNRSSASATVIGYVENYLPIGGEMHNYIFKTIAGVIKARVHAGAAAFLMLIWVGTQFFTTLVHAVNRAWGIKADKWWHLPLKNLILLSIMVVAVLAGMAVPVLGKAAKGLFFGLIFFSWIYNLVVFFLPWLGVFFSLGLFYKFAPRRRTRFSEVRLSALCATLLLLAAQNLFVMYMKHFSSFNAVYGAFGGIMALLLWIYLSGCIIIFCACLSAAQSEIR